MEQWASASLIYFMTFILLFILKYGGYPKLHNSSYFQLTRIQLFEFASTILIGYSAPDYIRYLFLGELLWTLFLYVFFSVNSPLNLLWRYAGLIIGFYLTFVPTPQQLIEHPLDSSVTIPVKNLAQRFEKPPYPNPYLNFKF